MFKTPILNAFPGLAVATAGVGLAWLGFRVSVWIPIAIVGSLVAAGSGAFWAGRRHLRADRPVEALKYMEWGVLAPGSLVAGVAGLLIGLGVFLEPVQDASLETKKLLAATSAAFGGFLTAAFVRSAEDADHEWVGEVVRAAFVDHFEERFPAGSDGANALTSNVWRGISGWGRAARKRRAEVIEGALSTPTGQ